MAFPGRSFRGPLPQADAQTKELARSLQATVIKLSEDIGERHHLPEFIPGVSWSDHWSFAQVGYSSLMVTDTAPFRNPNYHQSTDTADTLDYERMARVTLGLRQVLEELAGPAPK